MQISFLFVFENSHEFSSASPCFGNLPEPRIIVYVFFFVVFFCRSGMHIHVGINIHANHGYVTFKHSRVQSSQMSILIKFCDLKLFKYLW